MNPVVYDRCLRWLADQLDERRIRFLSEIMRKEAPLFDAVQFAFTKAVIRGNEALTEDEYYVLHELGLISSVGESIATFLRSRFVLNSPESDWGIR